MEINEDHIAWNTNKIISNKAKNESRAELDNVLNSKSYRIGRMITFIPRKIKGGIQCIRDHGMIYTIKLATKKLVKRR